MATLRMIADKAQPPSRPGGCPGWILAVGVMPAEEPVEIKTAADALNAFSAFVERVKAKGEPAYCYARLGKKDRAPNGFKKLDLSRFVNAEYRGA